MATQIWTAEASYWQAQHAAPEPIWVAIHTKARHEKKVDSLLRGKGIETFLPLVSKTQRWSDRKKTIEFPLFACYSFAQIAPTPESLVQVLRTPGVIRVIGNSGEPLAVPDKQIEDIRLLLSKGVPCWEHPFLSVGQRVRIKGGCLDGVEGILKEMRVGRTLLISAEPIQRSLAISVDDYEVEPL